MTEIRPIRADEAEGFLQLLCRAFTIESDRVRGVFFGEPFYDLGRKWALFDTGRMVSILTTTPLEFGWGRAAGIAGVATDPDVRGQGYAGTLLDHVVTAHRSSAEAALLLFAQDPRIYESSGFSLVDDIVRGPLDTTLRPHRSILDFDEVRPVYDRWADEDPRRLRRDERRWQYWKWNLRLCAPAGHGYICQEGLHVREGVGTLPGDEWTTTEACEWIGLRTMVEEIGAPLGKAEKATHLMGIGFAEPPQLFLTDQW